jgi:hypothetical protein
MPDRYKTRAESLLSNESTCYNLTVNMDLPCYFRYKSLLQTDQNTVTCWAGNVSNN